MVVPASFCLELELAACGFELLAAMISIPARTGFAFSIFTHEAKYAGS